MENLDGRGPALASAQVPGPRPSSDSHLEPVGAARGRRPLGRVPRHQRPGTSGWPVPEWAHWSGDPFFDNYSHAQPGTRGIYSSGGQWRLSQALTALWGKDIKQVLDDELFGEIGIPADRWDWTPGRLLHEERDWYPNMPGYGDFLDPPYEIDGNVVRGGPGWVVIGAKDLARFGHLVATGGVWRGRRLLGREWVIGHGGGNGSGVAGEGRHYTAFGIVTTDGIDYRDPFFPDELFTGRSEYPRKEL